jgi:hypothetical protein
MKASTRPRGILAKGMQARKIKADAATTPSANRRSPGPAGESDKKTRRSNALASTINSLGTIQIVAAATNDRDRVAPIVP